jgi:hypothetical protein
MQQVALADDADDLFASDDRHAADASSDQQLSDVPYRCIRSDGDDGCRHDVRGIHCRVSP